MQHQVNLAQNNLEIEISSICFLCNFRILTSVLEEELVLGKYWQKIEFSFLWPAYSKSLDSYQLWVKELHNMILGHTNVRWR